MLVPKLADGLIALGVISSPFGVLRVLISRPPLEIDWVNTGSSKPARLLFMNSLTEPPDG